MKKNDNSIKWAKMTHEEIFNLINDEIWDDAKRTHGEWGYEDYDYYDFEYWMKETITGINTKTIIGI